MYENIQYIDNMMFQAVITYNLFLSTTSYELQQHIRFIDNSSTLYSSKNLKYFIIISSAFDVDYTRC